MKFSREDILKITKDNNLETINQLIEHMDLKEFNDLVIEKNIELLKGKLMFRYEDREKVLNKYKKELYDKMISEGRVLKNVLKEEDSFKYSPKYKHIYCKNFKIEFLNKIILEVYNNQIKFSDKNQCAIKQNKDDITINIIEDMLYFDEMNNAFDILKYIDNQWYIDINSKLCMNNKVKLIIN